METHHEKRLPDGRRHLRRFPMFAFLIKRFGFLLKLVGLYERGVRNALDVRLNRIEIAFDDLPAAFDGFTILHLTDLHLDGLPEAVSRLADKVAEIEADVCVMTGDYRFHVSGPFDDVLPPLDALLGAVRARDGIFAILGNHDTVEMLAPFEARGIHVLGNESTTVTRGGDAVHLTGVDDVHYYYTDRAISALEAAPEGFRIALVHSPELAEPAAAAGMRLYLTGHTHGGQICLPGGIPIITNIAAPRAYASGLWRCSDMVGYTSTGGGISGLPVRFFSRSEAALITLRRHPD
jgi:predicted MPP superfamily phosphohydrolase